MTTPAEREAAALGILLSHGCCMEDYGFIGDEAVIYNGRDRYAQLLDAYRAAVAETVRAEADERCARLRARDAEIAKVRGTGEAVAWAVVDERGRVEDGRVYRHADKAEASKVRLNAGKSGPDERAYAVRPLVYATPPRTPDADPRLRRVARHVELAVEGMGMDECIHLTVEEARVLLTAALDTLAATPEAK